jgi:hypothetical protein
MNIWTLLLPFEVCAFLLLSVYLVHLERRARFLKRQDKRIELAKQLGISMEEMASS